MQNQGRSKKERDGIDTTVVGSLATDMVDEVGSSKSIARTSDHCHSPQRSEYLSISVMDETIVGLTF
jgi:hypothetical protein